MIVADHSIEYPSFITDDKWEFKSQGYVGYIPLSEDYHFSLQPKVPISNLFQMLEYAYNLKSFEFLPDLMESDTLNDFYERLANIFAKKVLDRCRKGFYCTYLNKCEKLPCIRGRLNIRHAVQRPFDINLMCAYQEHTPDIDDNQILAWTLNRITRSRLCSNRTLPVVRRAYRSLMGLVTPMPFSPDECIGRLYNRLNEDYQPMHCLCRFFLEHSGPSHKIGDHSTIPFLVNMPRLFEKFVAEWLKENLNRLYPQSNLSIRAQESVNFGSTHEIKFDIDLVIYDRITGNVKYVLDTKYKTTDTVNPHDIQQVVTYAEAKGCKEAILIYPQKIPTQIDVKIGGIRVRTLTFSLDKDLNESGEEFLSDLLK